MLLMTVSESENSETEIKKIEKGADLLLLKGLTDSQLLDQTQSLVGEERRIGAQILLSLREISRRRLYAELGYSSMFVYCVRELKYTESTACRLLQAAGVLSEFPEVEEKIRSGALSVSTLAQVQSYCLAQKRENGLEVQVEEKKEILESLEGKSKREAEKILASLHPECPLKVVRESERAVSAEETEIRFVVNDELLAKFKRIEDLMGHQTFRPRYAELFDRMAEIVLDRIDPIRRGEKLDKKKRTKGAQGFSKEEETIESVSEEDSSEERLSPVKGNTDSPDVFVEDPEKSLPDPTPNAPQTVDVDSSPPSSSRHVPAHIRREVWRRAGGQCCYVSPKSQKRCHETRGLEIEHTHPFGRGGSHDLLNLSLLCKTHNLLNAIKSYGPDKMERYLSES